MSMYLHCARGEQNAREIKNLKAQIDEMTSWIDELAEEVRERNQTINPQIYSGASARRARWLAANGGTSDNSGGSDRVICVEEDPSGSVGLDDRTPEELEDWNQRTEFEIAALNAVEEEAMRLSVLQDEADEYMTANDYHDTICEMYDGERWGCDAAEDPAGYEYVGEICDYCER